MSIQLSNPAFFFIYLRQLAKTKSVWKYRLQTHASLLQHLIQRLNYLLGLSVGLKKAIKHSFDSICDVWESSKHCKQWHLRTEVADVCHIPSCSKPADQIFLILPKTRGGSLISCCSKLWQELLMSVRQAPRLTVFNFHLTLFNYYTVLVACDFIYRNTFFFALL